MYTKCIKYNMSSYCFEKQRQVHADMQKVTTTQPFVAEIFSHCRRIKGPLEFVETISLNSMNGHFLALAHYVMFRQILGLNVPEHFIFLFTSYIYIIFNIYLYHISYIYIYNISYIYLIYKYIYI